MAIPYVPIIFGVFFLLGLGLMAVALIIDLDTEPSKDFSKVLLTADKMTKAAAIIVLGIGAMILVYSTYSPLGDKAKKLLSDPAAGGKVKGALNAYNQAADIVKG